MGEANVLAKWVDCGVRRWAYGKKGAISYTQANVSRVR